MNRRKQLLSMLRGLERSNSQSSKMIIYKVKEKLNKTEQVKKDLFGLDK